MFFVVRTKPWSNDGEPADQEVTGACLAERTAEGHEVFELRRAAVRAIWLIIHVSASSKDGNRYSPRGTRSCPRSRLSVRCRRATSSSTRAPGARTVTTFTARF